MGSAAYSTAGGEGGFWRSFLFAPLARLECEQREYLESPAGRRPDWKCVVVLTTTALVLTLHTYVGGLGVCRAAGWCIDLLGWPQFADCIFPAARDPQNGRFAAFSRDPTGLDQDRRLAQLTYATLGDLVFFVLLPALVVRAGFGERLRDYGMRLGGTFQDWWVYPAVLGVMLPLVLVVSAVEDFQTCYPYYLPEVGQSLWPRFWFWELQYLLSFFCVEFLFRGFMVHGTRRRFGVYAIFVMAVPYCMIHFNKPMLESLGSIIAGIVLGYMSLKTRSIWMGTILHMAVAFSMDMASLWRQGWLGGAATP